MENDIAYKQFVYHTLFCHSETKSCTETSQSFMTTQTGVSRKKYRLTSGHWWLSCVPRARFEPGQWCETVICQLRCLKSPYSRGMITYGKCILESVLWITYPNSFLVLLIIWRWQSLRTPPYRYDAQGSCQDPGHFYSREEKSLRYFSR